MRSKWLVVELAALAVAAAVVWWLASAGTAAWEARVVRLGLVPPDGAHGAARLAAIYLTAGIALLAAARAVGPGLRDLRRRGDGDPIAVPWLMPGMVAAAVFGFAVHVSTVEVVRGAVSIPTAESFAQGFLIGCVAGAAILLAPWDLARAIVRARLVLAGAVVAIFVGLAVAGSGPPGSGTRINLGPIQPIELVKLLAIAFLAAYLGARAPKLRWHRRRLLGLRWPRLELLVPAIVALLGIVAGLYVVGDLGPVLLLAALFLGMFYVTSRATGWVLVAFAIIAVVLVVFALAPGLAGGGTVKTRLVMWRDPWDNGMTNGQQLAEGLWAMAAGGWDGRGLGHATTPLVPAGKTDLVLVTLTEQLGARGLVAYQLALAAIVGGALAVAARTRTAERVLLASGIAILVLAQWLVILAGTLGYLPLTGIVVPFVSSGRSSMLVFVIVIAVVARLAADGRARERTDELAELHGAVRGVRAVAGILAVLAIVASLAAAVRGRETTTARGIVTKLADGTLVNRQNPRLVAIAERIRRGSILDRNGAPIATSPTATTRTYPLGNALGTLAGVSPSRVLLPAWALERRHELVLRGYPERSDGPPGLPSPDLTTFVPIIDLDDTARDAALAQLDAELPRRSVKVTIDGKLQTKIAELARAASSKRLAVATVVIDVDTGQVLARVQVPDYDPNAPAWQDKLLAGDAAFTQHFQGTYGEWPDKTGVHGMFQSGSVGKLVTALAAVRAGAAGARYECRDADAQGPLFRLPGWSKPIHDHTGDRTHGTPDIVDALAVSCNVYFAQLALALGPDPFAQLRRDGLDFGHASFAAGAPKTRQLASTGFGQGAMATSPLQAARIVAALAGGGRHVECPMQLGAACTEGKLVDDPAALRPVLAGMRRVMTAGTGARLTVPPGLRVYGKTGTADVHGFAGEEPFGIARGAAAPPHSWFVAFAEPTSVTELAPTAPGRLAVAVVIPRGGTGASAAGPLAMQILAAAHELGYMR